MLVTTESDKNVFTLRISAAAFLPSSSGAQYPDISSFVKNVLLTKPTNRSALWGASSHIWPTRRERRRAPNRVKGQLPGGVGPMPEGCCRVQGLAVGSQRCASGSASCTATTASWAPPEPGARRWEPAAANDSASLLPLFDSHHAAQLGPHSPGSRLGRLSTL